jgi:hypothetical protein
VYILLMRLARVPKYHAIITEISTSGVIERAKVAGNMRQAHQEGLARSEQRW